LFVDRRRTLVIGVTTLKKLIRDILAIGLASIACISAAHAVPIIGVTDPTNNTAEFTWEVSGGDLVISIANTCNFNCVITGFQFTITDSVAGTNGTMTVSGTLDDSGWSVTASVAGCGADNCVITGTNLNGGDTQDGIAVNGTGVFSLGGTFADPTNLANILVRFQQTGADGEGSDRGYVCTDTDCTPPVPEPAPLALLGLGLAAIGLSRRRTTT
jgi:hypothetical protein